MSSRLREFVCGVHSDLWSYTAMHGLASTDRYWQHAWCLRVYVCLFAAYVFYMVTMLNAVVFCQSILLLILLPLRSLIVASHDQGMFGTACVFILCQCV